MAKMFSDDITDYIIESVHEAEYMWNFNNPLYKLKSMKMNFWQKLANDINNRFNPGVPLQQTDVSRKWNNLKSYYNYETQKYLNAEMIDAGIDWKNKSKMDFLAGLGSSYQYKFHNKSTRSSQNPFTVTKDEEFMSQSNSGSQDEYDELWSVEDCAGNQQSSIQVPEISIDDAEEVKYSSILKKANSEIPNSEKPPSINTTIAHSSPKLPILNTGEEKSYNCKRPREEQSEQLTLMVANMMQQQKALFAQPASSPLQHPEMFAFWDSIIKDIPSEALPEIKFEVTALLHNIYKRYKK